MSRAHTSRCPECPARLCNNPQCGACHSHLEDHAEREVDTIEAAADALVAELDAELAASRWFAFPDDGEVVR